MSPACHCEQTFESVIKVHLLANVCFAVTGQIEVSDQPEKERLPHGAR